MSNYESKVDMVQLREAVRKVFAYQVPTEPADKSSKVKHRRKARPRKQKKTLRV